MTGGYLFQISFKYQHVKGIVKEFGKSWKMDYQLINRKASSYFKLDYVSQIRLFHIKKQCLVLNAQSRVNKLVMNSG